MSADQASTGTGAEEVAALAGAARFFGDLLLHELTLETLAVLQAEPLVGALGLGSLGTVPRTAAAVDELAADFHAALLAPTGGGAPPVASLWLEGRYEGERVARLRQASAAAGLDFDHEAARGAPIDHLGALLHLWASASERAPWLADELAAEHLDWTDRPLGQIEAQGGLYGELATALRAFVPELRATRLSPATR